MSDLAVTQTQPRSLSLRTLESILEVTQKLAAPFDLLTMLKEVIEATENVLDAENGSVWLYDQETDELVLRIARDMDQIRVPADQGIVGKCLQTNQAICVNDCYSDARFNPDVDRVSGYRTRCMLAIPLIGHGETRVGVLQVLNKRNGVFERSDQSVANALAAQCAVALQRAQMTEAIVASEKHARDIAIAHTIQSGTIPKKVPPIPGYDLAGIFRPARECSGDTYDLIPFGDDRLFILLGDATGHGIGPALSATQVRAMLRVAIRLGADLDSTFQHINNQLTDDLPDDRFVTAFLGALDVSRNVVEYHAGGQGPILHYHAADRRLEWLQPSTLAMGVMEQAAVGTHETIFMARGDILAIITDGVYETEAESGEQFGMERVGRIVREHHDRPMSELINLLLSSAQEFAGSEEASDDITAVLVRRLN